MLAIAVLPLIILGFTAIASVTEAGLAGPPNKGPHGFSEILYAFTSAVANNGSAFAGLTANTPFYNGMLGAAMWIGRFFIIIPMLAIAGGGGEEIYAGVGGQLPDDGAAVDGLACRHRADRRRPDLPAQPRARPDRRSSRDDQRPALCKDPCKWLGPKPNPCSPQG